MILDLARSLALAAAVVASTGAPAPAAPASPLGPLHRIVQQAAIDQGISYRLLDCIVQAESTYNPRAISRTNDHGLGQIHVYQDGTSLLDITPWAGGDLFDATTNAEATAWLIANGHGGEWATWPLCTR